MEDVAGPPGNEWRAAAESAKPTQADNAPPPPGREAVEELSAEGFDRLPGPYEVDEVAARKPGGLFEAKVVLADGQEWFLPKPRVRLSPSGEQTFKITLNVKGVDKYGVYLAALEKSETGSETVAAELAVARSLLVRNYELADAQIERLMQFSYMDGGEDPEGEALREAVMNVALGRGPKPRGGTAESA